MEEIIGEKEEGLVVSEVEEELVTTLEVVIKEQVCKGSRIQVRVADVVQEHLADLEEVKDSMGRMFSVTNTRIMDSINHIVDLHKIKMQVKQEVHLILQIIVSMEICLWYILGKELRVLLFGYWTVGPPVI